MPKLTFEDRIELKRQQVRTAQAFADYQKVIAQEKLLGIVSYRDKLEEGASP